jgi:hypothetical protein
LENGERPEPPNANPNANTEATAYAKTNLNPNTEAEAETETPLQPKSSVLEIVGSTGFFTFAERLNWDIPPIQTQYSPSWRFFFLFPFFFFGHCKAVHCLSW